MRMFSIGVAAASLAALAFASPVLSQQTIGPRGETPTNWTMLEMSDEDVAKLRDGGYSSAILAHVWADHTAAWVKGAEDEFERLGIKVNAVTNAEFNPAVQRSDVETVLASNPDLILAVPVDPATATEAFRSAVEANVKLVFLAAVPDGYEHGKEYVSLATDDLFQMGERAADAMAQAIGGKGKIAYVYYDATLYVPNSRDQAFIQTIRNKYPDIEIAVEQGIVDPNRASEIADALLIQHPDLDGIYVTWAQPAEGFLASLRAAGNTTTKIVTMDLSEPLALDMLAGGHTAAIVADEAYNYGVAAARAGAIGLLERPVPDFLIVDALTITRDNIREGWNRSLHTDPPAAVLEKLSTQ